MEKFFHLAVDIADKNDDDVKTFGALERIQRKDQPMGIAERIRLLRKESGMRRSEVAAKLGVNQRTIANWEKGITQPPTLMIVAYAEMFDVDTATIIEGEK